MSPVGENVMQPNAGEAIGAGILAIAISLSIHAVFMFATLKLQLALRERFPALKGIKLIIPSILLPTALIVTSTVIQICIWGVIANQTGHFESFRDAAYFAGMTYHTLGADAQLTIPYRVFEPLMAMNGMLTTGLNTAILFAIISNMSKDKSQLRQVFE